jgi:hypothetical protein
MSNGSGRSKNLRIGIRNIDHHLHTNVVIKFVIWFHRYFFRIVLDVLLSTVTRRIETDIYVTEGKIRDDVDKHKKYRIGKGVIQVLTVLSQWLLYCGVKCSTVGGHSMSVGWKGFWQLFWTKQCSILICWWKLLLMGLGHEIEFKYLYKNS